MARGALHSLALHGVALSLVTHRDWVVRQLSRLAPIGLQNINISFGRHVLAALPSWLRRGGGVVGGTGSGARHSGGAQPAPDSRDMAMLEQLADVFRAAPEVHFVMHSGEFEESVHSQPWGLPVPEGLPGPGGAPVGVGPLGEGVEEGGFGADGGGGGLQQPAGALPPEGDHLGLPLRIRLLAHVLAVVVGPREAVRVLAQNLAAANEDAPPHWQVSAALWQGAGLCHGGFCGHRQAGVVQLRFARSSCCESAQAP